MEGWPAQPPAGREQDGELRFRPGWRYFALLPIITLVGAPFFARLAGTSYVNGYLRGLVVTLLITVVHYAADWLRRDDRAGPTAP